MKRGSIPMKIAVPYENGSIFGHFGHTRQFKIYSVNDGNIRNAEVVPTLGQGHGALAGFLAHRDVDVLICGGIGAGAVNALAEAGISLCAGASGDADCAVADYLAGRLSSNTVPTCNHHEAGHGNTCGSHEHSCGEHSCH